MELEKIDRTTLCISLTDLHYEQVIKTGIVPTGWTNANVTPLNNEGNRDNPNNYCPISALPVLKMIIEYAINSQLRDFLFTDNILT